MKIKINEETKQNALALILAGCTVVGFYAILTNLDPIRIFLYRLLMVLMPFILGFFFAFLLNSLNRKIENGLLKKWNVKFSMKRKVSVALTFCIFLVVLIWFIYIILNQVIVSVNTFIATFSMPIGSTESYFTELFDKIAFSQEQFDWLFNVGKEALIVCTDYLTGKLPTILSYSVNIATQFANCVIGFVIAVYILLDRERIYFNTKKTIVAVFPEKSANWLFRFAELCSKMFNSFIIGKVIDSFIIGILCYIGMTILKLEFAILISFIVGVTNMIPFFGPFIGAVPGMIILLIADPQDCLVFAIWIFALQQFDGNILGPKILGDSMGLSTIWIMFAIIVGGAFFGIVGMFLSVPFFAVIYHLLKDYIDSRLVKKKIKLEQ